MWGTIPQQLYTCKSKSYMIHCLITTLWTLIRHKKINISVHYICTFLTKSDISFKSKEEFHKNIYLFKNGNTYVTVPQHNIWTKQGQNTNQTPVKDYWSCKRSLLRREVSSCGQTMLSFNKTPFGKVILWFWNISVDFFSLSVLTTTSGTDWNRKILYTNNFI